MELESIWSDEELNETVSNEAVGSLSLPWWAWGMISTVALGVALAVAFLYSSYKLYKVNMKEFNDMEFSSSPPKAASHDDVFLTMPSDLSLSESATQKKSQIMRRNLLSNSHSKLGSSFFTNRNHHNPLHLFVRNVSVRFKRKNKGTLPTKGNVRKKVQELNQKATKETPNLSFSVINEANSEEMLVDPFADVSFGEVAGLNLDPALEFENQSRKESSPRPNEKKRKRFKFFKSEPAKAPAPTDPVEALGSLAKEFIKEDEGSDNDSRI